MKKLSGRDRLKYLPLFDFTRKKLAIDIQCLKEIHLQQLRKKAYQNLNENGLLTNQNIFIHPVIWFTPIYLKEVAQIILAFRHEVFSIDS